jgi:hypothetical protein
MCIKLITSALLLTSFLLSGCATSLNNIIDELNNDIKLKDSSNKVKEFNRKNASSISFDELNVYTGMDKKDVISRLYTGLTMTPIKDNESDNKVIINSKERLAEVFNIIKLKNNEQIELGQITFLDNKLFEAVRYHKTYEENDSLKALNFFIDIALKTQYDFDADSNISFYRRKANGDSNGISIEFVNKIDFFSKKIEMILVKSNNQSYVYVRELLLNGISRH